jgi:Omp85 superfamily domain
MRNQSGYFKRALSPIFFIVPLSLAIHGSCGEDALVPPAAEQPPTFDPFQGMDRSGRIPKVTLPSDIRHPERWRYIPEGRIKPGNIWERFWVTSFITPVVYFEEDIGLGGGLALTDIDFREQRRREFAGIFLSASSEGQETYKIVWQRWLNHRTLPTGGVVMEERSFMRGVAAYDRSLTRRFFGFGSRSQKDDETSFTDEASYAEASVQTTVPHPGDDFVVQLGFRGEHRNLFRGQVKNMAVTEDIYPELVRRADSYDSAWVNGLLRYDRRDSPHNPYRGWMVEASVDSAPWQQSANSDTVDSGAIWTVAGTLAIPIPGLFHAGAEGNEENPPTDVIAVGGFAQATSGDMPFWALPSLGGSKSLRGYIANRFTDRSAWHLSAEYRFWVIPRGAAITDTVRFERFGLALFYELGTVAPSVNDFSDAKIHDSYGLSFRAMLERTALFRADLGWCADGFSFNFGYGLSF